MLPSPLKASLDASQQKMMAVFRAKFDAENSTSIQGSTFDGPLGATSSSRVIGLQRPRTAFASDEENNMYKARPRTVDNSMLTGALSRGGGRGGDGRNNNNNNNNDNNYNNKYDNHDGDQYEYEGRYSLWNDDIPSSGHISSTLRTSLSLAGVNYSDLKWERFRLHG